MSNDSVLKRFIDLIYGVVAGICIYAILYQKMPSPSNLILAFLLLILFVCDWFLSMLWIITVRTYDLLMFFLHLFSIISFGYFFYFLITDNLIYGAFFVTLWFLFVLLWNSYSERIRADNLDVFKVLGKKIEKRAQIRINKLYFRTLIYLRRNSSKYFFVYVGMLLLIEGIFINNNEYDGIMKNSLIFVLSFKCTVDLLSISAIQILVYWRK